MLPWSRAAGLLGCGLVLSIPRAAWAESAEPLHVWYRSTPGCPDGAEFLARLGRFGRSASLAQVGDKVDFVVSLAASAGSSSGRLERQSDSGAVAIRELVANDCAEVAEGLALSLELALQPDVGTQPLPPPAAAPSLPATPPEPRWQASIGAQGGIETGLAGALLPGAALFGELGSNASTWSARLSARGAYGAGEAEVSVVLGTGRVEACMRVWSTASVALSPCLGLDLGVVRADSSEVLGQTDTGLWASGVGHLRAAWQWSDGFSLEGQVGAAVPFVRYQFRSELGRDIAGSDPIGLQAAVGAALLL